MDAYGAKYILPGLIISDEKRPSKKFYSTPYAFSKQQVMQFAHSIVEEAERVQKAKGEELRVLIHDLRALSSAIYNTAELARTACEAGSFHSVRERIETVIATHTMLSIRIDMLDYASNQIATADFERVPVFKKVDKVVRCFRPKASARGVTLDLRGPSAGLTYGPTIFELIPYAIIDNAVKYAPNNSIVSISVEDGVTEIRVRVRSLGPLIEPNEKEKIFDRGYRGRHALRTPQPGTGLGLNTAKQLLEDYFHGSISVAQDDAVSSFGPTALFPTEFEIVVPNSAALRRRVHAA